MIPSLQINIFFTLNFPELLTAVSFMKQWRNQFIYLLVFFFSSLSALLSFCLLMSYQNLAKRKTHLIIVFIKYCNTQILEIRIVLCEMFVFFWYTVLCTEWGKFIMLFLKERKPSFPFYQSKGLWKALTDSWAGHYDHQSSAWFRWKLSAIPQMQIFHSSKNG